jgi:hypothetical protein
MEFANRKTEIEENTRRRHQASGNHADDQSKERCPFDQSGSNDHGTTNVTSNFRLTSHALHSSRTDFSDSVCSTQHHNAGASGTSQINQSLTGRSSGDFVCHCRSRHQYESRYTQKAHFDELSHNTTPLSETNSPKVTPPVSGDRRNHS